MPEVKLCLYSTILFLQYESVILLAAGTGIAPMIQVIRHILANEDDDTVIHLLYSVKKYADVMCRDLLDLWNGFWNFKITFFVTRVGIKSMLSVFDHLRSLHYNVLNPWS